MFNELLKERLLDAHLEFFRKDKKKFLIHRILYAVVVTMLYAMVIMVIKMPIWLIGLPAAFYLGWKFAYLKLLSTKNNIDVKNSFLFPQFLQSFIALLPSSGNVYQTLKATTYYTPDPLDKELIKLIQKIENGNDRNAYLAFADYIGSSEAYMVMNMIYQFSEQGVEKESIQELERYIQNLQENKVDELIQHKMNASDKFGLFPILISLFLVIGFAGVIFLHYMTNVTDALNTMPK
ncbi:flagellar assembly protein FlaJ [Lysinibacillus sphaericus]|uniref:flagellar assembly protein FlaJ n=1 Tax=Lysinibacillus sphaericus TaxID=1421 RepID=UPI001A9CF2D5|nr:flagellar assembly protein FlaJ [Lysinibacillus sphaericus]QTB28874.1 flagellar assembly protein FlaJ [Lysinibacillus sphaericus]